MSLSYLTLKDNMSFDNLKNPKIERLNLALLTLFTFLSLIFAVFIPILGVAGIILLPIPVTILFLGGRIKDGIICVTIACIILVFLDYVMAPVAAILIVAISFIYKSSVGRGKSKLSTIGYILLTFWGALFLYFLLTSAVNRVNYINVVIENYNTYIDHAFSDQSISEYASLLSIDSSQFGTIMAQVRDIVKFIIYIIPGILISLITFISVMNYKATSAVLLKYDIDVKPFTSFRYWDIPWYYCWGVILGLVLVLIPYGSQNLNKIMDIAGFNLLAVFGSLYLILGISVIWGLLEKYKVTLIWRTGIFILLGFGLFLGFTLLILPFMGLIDIWINFRRLERKQLA